jgi:hypothetical protein
MQSGLKLEIIVDQLHVPTVIRILEKTKVEGYTIIRGLTGSGDRGEKDGEGLTGLFSNAMIIVACEQSDYDDIQEDLRKLFRTIGGICMIQPIQWLS